VGDASVDSVRNIELICEAYGLGKMADWTMKQSADELAEVGMLVPASELSAKALAFFGATLSILRRERAKPSFSEVSDSMGRLLQSAAAGVFADQQKKELRRALYNHGLTGARARWDGLKTQRWGDVAGGPTADCLWKRIQESKLLSSPEGIAALGATGLQDDMDVLKEAVYEIIFSEREFHQLNLSLNRACWEIYPPMMTNSERAEWQTCKEKVGERIRRACLAPPVPFPHAKRPLAALVTSQIVPQRIMAKVSLLRALAAPDALGWLKGVATEWDPSRTRNPGRVTMLPPR